MSILFLFSTPNSLQRGRISDANLTLPKEQNENNVFSLSLAFFLFCHACHHLIVTIYALFAKTHQTVNRVTIYIDENGC